MKEVLRSLFSSAKGSISSKRVCGVFGWIFILGCYGYCCLTGKDMPNMGELILGTVALLGVDSIAQIFRKDGQ